MMMMIHHSYSELTKRLKTMKLTSFIASRPVLVFVFLAFIALLIPSIVIPCWYKTTQRIEQNVVLAIEHLRLGLVSEIGSIGSSIFPANSPAVGLAKVIESSLNNENYEPSFSDIKTKMAPILFEAYSVIPKVTQVSYIGLNGLFFSFFMDVNRTLAIFSNNTFSSGSSNSYTWYQQTIDQTTGQFDEEEAVISRPLNITGTDWFREALGDNDTGGGYYASLGTRWGKVNDSLFLNTVSLFGRKGVVSLGFSVNTITDMLNRLNLHGGELYLLTVDGEMLLEGSRTDVSLSVIPPDRSVCFSSSVSQYSSSNTQEARCISCNGTTGKDLSAIARIQGYCSVLEAAGVPLVQVLMFPEKEGTADLVAKNSKTTLILLVLMPALSMVAILSFVMLMVRAARREMHLCSTLINQMEATQQAERKSMNKSIAFASASHDIRGSLAAITGLVELCYNETESGSELETNLKQIQGCTADLVGLLNSILDMSKIEAGKMQLEEEEFNLAELLEEVVDSFHPLGMKKGVDVVLDPHDGTMLKFSNVRGDRGKLRQILNNLVSNAVKFTSQGHVSIRAWARKPSSESSVVLASNPSRSSSRFLSRFFCKGKESRSDVETVHSVRKNMNTMEFVFEVDDTGKGIPKEMQKLVFENYVQVRETAQGQQGTGLGLGIVQSLVRLMGGELRIVDKDMGEKGTCFRFNVFLTTLESPINDVTMRQDIEAKGDCLSTPNIGLTIRTSSASRSIRSLSPRLNNILLSSSPKPESSQVILLLKDEERRRVTQKYMEGLGINVVVVDEPKQLGYVLKRVKSKLCGSSPQSSIGRAESNSRSEISCSSSKELPMSTMDGAEQIIPLNRRRNNSATRFVLLVIDASAGPFSELSDAVEQFRGALHHGVCCKVVWLNKPSTRGTWGDDVSFLKPLHGSRLKQVMKMLPEFGGALPKESPSELQTLRHSSTPAGSLKDNHNLGKKHLRAPKHKKLVSWEIQEEESSSEDKKQRRKKIISPPESDTQVKRSSRHAVGKINQVAMADNNRPISEPSSGKCLRGKKVLIVDDNKYCTVIAERKLSQQGATTIEICYNGADAVRLVAERFREQRNTGGCLNDLPFDYIFMDCQMPGMNGYEATRQIREIESHHGIHIPIIAITADGPHSKEAHEAIEAGMDIHLGKELAPEHLVKAIRDMNN